MEAAPDAHQERHHAEESLKELEREILGSKHDLGGETSSMF